jgi:hypothetical protein
MLNFINILPALLVLLRAYRQTDSPRDSTGAARYAKATNNLSLDMNLCQILPFYIFRNIYSLYYPHVAMWTIYVANFSEIIPL